MLVLGGFCVLTPTVVELCFRRRALLPISSSCSTPYTSIVLTNNLSSSDVSRTSTISISAYLRTAQCVQGQDDMGNDLLMARVDLTPALDAHVRLSSLRVILVLFVCSWLLTVYRPSPIPPIHPHVPNPLTLPRLPNPLTYPPTHTARLRPMVHRHRRLRLLPPHHRLQALSKRTLNNRSLRPTQSDRQGLVREGDAGAEEGHAAGVRA